jgi:hypothetical protein
MIAGAGAALADTTAVDGDLTTPWVADSTLAFGDVACNADVSNDVAVWAVRNGQINNNTFANSAALALGASLAPGSSGVTFGLASGSPTLPTNWATPGVLNNGATSTTAKMPLTVHPTATGSYSATVNISLTGNAYEGGTLTRTSPLTVTWSTECTAQPPANTAPSDPGVPTATQNPTQGGFKLSWAASTDAENDVFTYTLQGKRTDDAAWATIASGLTTASYDFATNAPAEGTWIYQVKAVETSMSPALTSGYSAASVPVVVDRTAPNPPTATADRVPEYTAPAPEGTTWWKGKVTVSFAGNGDPNLADGSAGSGVDPATIPASKIFDTQGAFTASGTLKDLAGNESSAATLSGSVDNAAPVLNAVCPTGTYILGSSASMSWTATDAGGSGVDGADSGTITLDTSTVGPHSVTIPAVMDHVGYMSNTVTCDNAYNVIYSFTGFFKPVVMAPSINSAKAGSAVPIKFTLGGYSGLTTAMSSFAVTGAAVNGDNPVDAVTAGQSTLQYDPTIDQYTYVWKTDKLWAGKTGTFTLTLNDGTTHTATFTFK